jgi:hypothetical protein
MFNTVSTLWSHISSGVLTKLHFVGLMLSLDHPTHYEFAFLDVRPGVKRDNLCRELVKTIQDVIMGTRDDRALEREARKYVSLMDVRKLTELEQKLYDVELSSQP